MVDTLFFANLDKQTIMITHHMLAYPEFTTKKHCSAHTHTQIWLQTLFQLRVLGFRVVFVPICWVFCVSNVFSKGGNFLRHKPWQDHLPLPCWVFGRKEESGLTVLISRVGICSGFPPVPGSRLFKTKMAKDQQSLTKEKKHKLVYENGVIIRTHQHLHPINLQWDPCLATLCIQ